MSSDSIMLDSPAHTPTPNKSHPAPSTASVSFPADVAMMIDESNSGAPSVAAGANSWDTKKYREELSHIRSRLQHHNFDIAKFRDPLNRPLVTGPPDLTSDVQERMRKLFQERVSR